MSPQEIMDFTLQLAIENVSSGRGGPFAAVIVKDKKIICQAVNEVLSNNDPTAHAEVQAIRNACQALNHFQLDECEIYCSCEPCPMCLGAIYWARPKAVYFASTRLEASQAGFDDQFIYDEMSKNHELRKIVMKQLTHENYLAPFQKWIELEVKTPY